ncbi:unnamed protein product, partial [Urochloa humidicola]
DIPACGSLARPASWRWQRHNNLAHNLFDEMLQPGMENWRCSVRREKEDIQSACHIITNCLCEEVWI